MKSSKRYSKGNKSAEKARCPFCDGDSVIKKGKRHSKYEDVQLYYCRNCEKKFTPKILKNKSFPLRVILDSITLYNRFNSLESSAKLVSDKYGIKVSSQNISNWLKDFKEYIPFLRMRQFISLKYDKKEIFAQTRMFHGQIYDYKFHRAKCDLLLEDDFKNFKLSPIREFLELVIAECPHYIYKESSNRASQYKGVFNLDGVKIVSKTNAANRNARLFLEPVSRNSLRHEVLQEYMLVNDSVTVACEVPILIDRDDVFHYKNLLGFDVPLDLGEGEVITGHIDVVQIRNGLIHILDYKPGAKRSKPVDQLMIYALSLSRLTGLRLIHFKCAWFDDKDYFEFFPLHVVYKKKRGKKAPAGKRMKVKTGAIAS